jgi:hypothetical protein
LFVISVISVFAPEKPSSTEKIKMCKENFVGIGKFCGLELSNRLLKLHIYTSLLIENVIFEELKPPNR